MQRSSNGTGTSYPGGSHAQGTTRQNNTETTARPRSRMAYDSTPTGSGMSTKANNITTGASAGAAPSSWASTVSAHVPKGHQGKASLAGAGHHAATAPSAHAWASSTAPLSSVDSFHRASQSRAGSDGPAGFSGERLGSTWHNSKQQPRNQLHANSPRAHQEPSRDRVRTPLSSSTSGGQPNSYRSNLRSSSTKGVPFDSSAGDTTGMDRGGRSIPVVVNGPEDMSAWRGLEGMAGHGEHFGLDGMPRPPPAGMRGALSWGVGPNAFEVDGRPGTRGGGPAYELDGRPVTRNGARPPSRMQLGMQQRGPADIWTAPTPTAGGHLAPLQGAPTPTRTGQTGQAPGSSIGANNGSKGSGQRGRGQAPAASMPAPRASTSNAAPGSSSAAGAGPAKEPHSPRGMPRGSAGALTGKPPQPHSKAGGQPSSKPSTAAAVQQLPLAANEHDIEQLIEQLSDEEDGDPNSLDDLNKYLSTLDQDDARGKAGSAGKAASPALGSSRNSLAQIADTKSGREGIKSAGGQAAQSDSQSGPVTPAPDSSIPPQYQHLPRKAVKAALRLIDQMVAQAARTGEINLLIRAAEAKELSQEQELGVVLSGDGWQETVRMEMGDNVDNEFSGLISAVKLPNAKPAGAADRSPVSPAPMPADDFKYLSGAPGTLRPASKPPLGAVPVASKGALAPLGNSTSPDFVTPSMARYAVHRIH